VIAALRRVRIRPAALALDLLTYAIALFVFFPILWTVLTGFKSEVDAAASPPVLFFDATLDNYQAVFSSHYRSYFENSVLIAGGSTLVALVLGLPAAYSLAFNPSKRSPAVLSWVLSTKMLPLVGALIPLLVIYKRVGLFDSRLGMILLYAAFNLPLVIWMMRSFFADLPRDILEAAIVDGARFFRIMTRVVLPLTAPGLDVVGPFPATPWPGSALRLAPSFCSPSICSPRPRSARPPDPQRARVRRVGAAGRDRLAHRVDDALRLVAGELAGRRGRWHRARC